MKNVTLTAVAILLFGCSRSAPVANQPAATTGTVTIKIAGDSEQTIEVADIASGTTLEAVMRSLADPPIKLTGSGTTAFVDAIGDRATNSTDGWTFKVDGQHANQGIGGTVLNPPTTVIWSFGDYESE